MRRDDRVLSLFSLKGFLSSKYSRLPDWTLDTLQMLPAGEKKGKSRETSSCLASRFKTANKNVGARTHARRYICSAVGDAKEELTKGRDD